MSENELFEARLRAAMRRHAAQATSDIDPVAFAHAIASAEPRRNHGTGIAWPAAPMTARFSLARVAWMLLVTVLLAALIGDVVMVATRHIPGGWIRLGMPAGDKFVDLAAGPGGYVAIGTNQDGKAAAWVSSDCRRWNTTNVSDSTGAVSFSAITAGGPGYVAIGIESTQVWGSTDGLDWRPIGSLPSDAWPLDIAANKDHVVVVGTSEGKGEQAIWTSNSGAAWTRATLPGDAARGYAFDQLRAVAATAEGFVAVGNAENDAAIWTSRDGLTWTRVAMKATPSYVATASDEWDVVGSVMIDRTGAWTAFGWHSFSGFGVWSSHDRASWTYTLSAGISVADNTLPAIAATNYGFVAAYTETPSASPASPSAGEPVYQERGVLATSGDGQTWSRQVATIGNGRIDRVFSCGSDLLLTGVAASPKPGANGWYGWEETPSTWLLPGGAAYEDRVVEAGE